MPLAVIALRFVQLCGATILFGSTAFLLYSPLLEGHDAPRWPKHFLTLAATALVIATPLGFLLQTADLAGSFANAMVSSDWHTALFQMSFGKSSIFRFAGSLVALMAVLATPNGRGLWWLCAIIGASICASFAWMGHGAATEGPIGLAHLAADIFHILAAAGWIGALIVLCVALCPKLPTNARNLHAALTAFSGIGSGFVAVIVLTGLVNSAFLAGWDVPRALKTGYGQVLACKLALFVLMLALAAVNRFRLTPALGGKLSFPAITLGQLRRSIGLETVCAFGVLALVSWLGTFPPVLE